MLNLVSSRIAQRLMALAKASLRGMTERTPSFAGQWVALDHCEYLHGGEQPSAGRIVDSDIDLSELCSRLRNASHRRCVIVRADDGYTSDGSQSSPALRRTRKMPTAA